MRPETQEHPASATTRSNTTPPQGQLALPEPVSRAGEESLTQKDAAELLGVGLRTIQRMVADGRLQTIEVGTKRYILHEPLLQLAQQLTETTQSEPAPSTDAWRADGTAATALDERTEDWLDPDELVLFDPEPEPATRPEPDEQPVRPPVAPRPRSRGLTLTARRLGLAAALIVTALLATLLPLTLGDHEQASPPTLDAGPQQTQTPATQPDSPSRRGAPLTQPDVIPDADPAPLSAAGSEAAGLGQAAEPPQPTLPAEQSATPPMVRHDRADAATADPTPTAPTNTTAPPAAPTAPPAPIRLQAEPRVQPAPVPSSSSAPRRGPGDNVCRAMGLCP